MEIQLVPDHWYRLLPDALLTLLQSKRKYWFVCEHLAGCYKN